MTSSYIWRKQCCLYTTRNIPTCMLSLKAAFWRLKMRCRLNFSSVLESRLRTLFVVHSIPYTSISLSQTYYQHTKQTGKYTLYSTSDEREMSPVSTSNFKPLLFHGLSFFKLFLKSISLIRNQTLYYCPSEMLSFLLPHQSKHMYTANSKLQSKLLECGWKI